MSAHSCQRVVKRVTIILSAAVLVIFSACGAQVERASGPGASKEQSGAGSPGAAVDAFVAVAGSPSQANLRKACDQLSPGVRPALRFQATVTPDDGNCLSALSLALYYTGDTGDVPVPRGFTAEAGAVVAHGDRAYVSVNMHYQGVPDGDHTVRVLTVREAGQWWVATPSAFNLRYAAKPLAEPALLAEYRELLAAARGADRQTEAGQNASSALGGTTTACPRDGASAGHDAHGDVKVADGEAIAKPQRPSDDLVDVIHNRDGDSACFALRFAGDAPSRGNAEFAIRPNDRRVTVHWEAGRAVGQRKGTDDNPVAVRVDAARDGSALVIRIPNRDLGITTPTYRWAVEAYVPTDQERVTNMDTVPDDLTVTRSQDHYIPHGQ